MEYLGRAVNFYTSCMRFLIQVSVSQSRLLAEVFVYPVDGHQLYLRGKRG